MAYYYRQSYLVKDGTERDFDMTSDSIVVFGFKRNRRVMTPRGPARVIGVHGRQLYFHVESDCGASFWSNCHKAEDFVRRGFFEIPEEIQGVGPDADPRRFHKVKHVLFQGKVRTLVLQSVNGPCPIFALANALLLQGQLADMVDPNKTVVDSVKLRSEVLNFISQKHDVPPFATTAVNDTSKKVLGEVGGSQESIEKLRADLEKKGPDMLKRLYEGLDVYPFFCDCDAFEYSDDGLIFAFAGVRVLHGWVIDPNNEDLKCIRDKTYEEVTVLQTDDTSDLSKPSKKFINSADFTSQLTQYGLQKLYDSVTEGEVVVLFHRLHFSTLTKLKGRLLELVSDEGYFDRSLIVFQELCLGNQEFYDGNGDTLADYVKAVISAFGNKYSGADIQKSHDVLQQSREGKEPTSDEIIRHLVGTLPTGSAVVQVPIPARTSPSPQKVPQTVTPEQPTAPPPSSTAMEDEITDLMSMGFERDKAEEAMRHCGSVQQAVEWILSNL